MAQHQEEARKKASETYAENKLLLDENERLKKSHVPQEVVMDLYKFLKDIDFEGQPNTLWALVKRASVEHALMKVTLEHLSSYQNSMGASARNCLLKLAKPRKKVKNAN